MKWLVIALALPLVGCSTSNPDLERQVDRLVNQKKPVVSEPLIKKAVLATLKDPFSVKEFRSGSPISLYMNAQSVMKIDRDYNGLWAVCARYYAKNSFGAYGPGLSYVVFENGRIIDVVAEHNMGQGAANCGR